MITSGLQKNASTSVLKLHAGSQNCRIDRLPRIQTIFARSTQPLPNQRIKKTRSRKTQFTMAARCGSGLTLIEELCIRLSLALLFCLVCLNFLFQFPIFLHPLYISGCSRLLVEKRDTFAIRMPIVAFPSLTSFCFSKIFILTGARRGSFSARQNYNFQLFFFSRECGRPTKVATHLEFMLKNEVGGKKRLATLPELKKEATL